MTTAFRKPGSLYKFGLAESDSFGLAQLVTPAIDTAKMSATAAICTPTIDYEDEVIEPSGIEWESRYAKNPVVLWEHGKEPLIPLPIAKCITPEGRTALRMEGDELIGTSFFTNSTRESEQIFALISDGIVRATSVRVDPVEMPLTKSIDARRVTYYPKSSLIEWSWGCMGVNPDTVAKVLTKNRLAGSAICEPLLKTLRPLAPRPNRAAVRVGWDALKAKSMATTPEEEAAAANPESGSPPAAPPPATAPAPAAPPASEAAPASEAPADEAGEDSDLSPSGKVLKAIHGSVNELLANIDSVKSQYENPDAIAGIAAVVEKLQEIGGEVDALFGSVTEGKSLASGEEPHAEEELVKSWLAGNRMGRIQLGGFGKQLGQLAHAKNLTPTQRATITGACRYLQKTIGAAAAQKQAEPDPKLQNELAETRKDFAAVTKTLNSVTERLQQLTPAT